jgi:hypothetical protein
MMGHRAVTSGIHRGTAAQKRWYSPNTRATKITEIRKMIDPSTPALVGTRKASKRRYQAAINGYLSIVTASSASVIADSNLDNAFDGLPVGSRRLKYWQDANSYANSCDSRSRRR